MNSGTHGGMRKNYYPNEVTTSNQNVYVVNEKQIDTLKESLLNKCFIFR